MEEALAGLSGEPPKKSSRPSNCFDGVDDRGGGGLVLAPSVVFGLAGGPETTSPNKSIVFAARLAGAGN